MSYRPLIKQALTQLPQLCKDAVSRTPQVEFLGVKLLHNIPKKTDDGCLGLQIAVFTAESPGEQLWLSEDTPIQKHTCNAILKMSSGVPVWDDLQPVGAEHRGALPTILQALKHKMPCQVTKLVGDPSPTANQQIDECLDRIPQKIQ